MGCEKDLETIPTDRFASETIAASADGVKAVLFSAYNTNNRGDSWNNGIMLNEVSTDIAFNSGGNANRNLIPFINFTVDASSNLIQYLWNQSYFTIRDANIVLESLEAGDFDPDFKREISAEARYLRAFEYASLYNYFGRVPLRTGSTQEGGLPRASAEEIETFIASELTDILADLPAPGEEEYFGRANKGQALGVLTKFYLNTKQWQKAVSASKQLMDLNYYALYPTYREMFFIENEQNREMIVAWSSINQAGPDSSWFQCGAFPPGFKRAPNIPEFVFVNGQMKNFATQYRLLDAFVDSFDPNDARLQAIVQIYEKMNGEMVNLRDSPDDSRPMKFFDQNALQNDAGNDQMVVRYADILLSRAEALNHVNGGSTQESVDLVNQVRERSKLSGYTLAQAGSESNFNDLILKERGWEFYSEALRREDLIRNGVYISRAKDRGKNAQPYQILFPIPQQELNSNSALTQNEGY
jgi:hypothetical protein